MTEQIKSALEVLGTYDMSDDNDDTEFKYSIKLSIRSLNAWEEVIAQLKSRRDYYEKKDYGLFVEVNACINIIESLLEGVTE